MSAYPLLSMPHGARSPSSAAPKLSSSQASGDEATTWREERMTGGGARYGDGAMTQKEERKTGGGSAGCECQMRMRNRERESKERRRERGGMRK